MSEGFTLNRVLLDLTLFSLILFFISSDIIFCFLLVNDDIFYLVQ